MPTIACFLASTTAFDFTWRTARQANSRSVSSSSVGRRWVTGWSLSRSSSISSKVWTSSPPPMRLKSKRPMPSSSDLAVGRRDLDDLEAALRPQDLERLGRVAGRDDRLEEARADGARGGLVDRPVRADDAAVGGDAVALERQAEGLGEVHDRGEAARIAVLDDRDRRRLEVRRDRPRRIEVEQVVEARGPCRRSGARR